MKATVTALMYSGAQNPERELNEEEVNHINVLASQLTETAPYNQHALGFSGFTAFTSDEEGKTNWGTYGFFNGCAQVWDNNKLDWICYYDTPGICAYLFTLMNSTLQDHYREATETMKKHMEQFGGVIDDFTCI